MKIKSKLSIIFVLCLALLLAVSLVACNDNNGDGKDDGLNKYETSTYTVTFNTDSKDMTSISTPTIPNVKSGSKISEPTDADGKKIVPYKRGYVFKFWAKSNGDEFDFKNDTITENTTLKATYEPIVYYHSVNLAEKYVYDRTEVVDETETDIYEKVERDASDAVTLADEELDKTTTHLKSTYASTNSSLPCPTSDTQDNKFCFWYYVNKDGKPIQFSKWAGENDTTVNELISYSIVSDDANDITKGLVLYPMFTNDLPKVTVIYQDVDGSELFDSEDYRFGQNVAKETSTGPIPDKDDYKFVEWYYELEKTSNGTTTVENTAFVFDDGKDNTKPTSPIDAAGAENNFKPVELVLKAKWIREITITNAASFNLFYDELKGLTAIAAPTDEEQAKLDEILNANILINGTINLGTDTYEPLFDKAHSFKGTIDGLTKTGETTSENAVLTGGKFGDATSASVFGYNEGTIQNVDFKNIELEIKDATAATVYLGVIATDNTGTIENCNVDNAFSLSDLHSVVFGGITATNHGTTKNGIIRHCNVDIDNFSANCKALTFGGIAGESNVSASIVNCNVNINISDANCVDDKNSKNGKSALIVGGLVGFNSSAIRLCKVTLTLKNATSLTEFVFGGATGVNNGSIRTTYAVVELGEEAVPVKARGALVESETSIGGLIGRNGGYVLNCYASANLYVEISDEPANGSNLYVGGLVGSNYSGLTDNNETVTESGICAINYCYTTGEIVVKVSDSIKSVNAHVGGIAGRNSHKKVASLFSAVKINVTNDGNNYLGHIFGKMVNDVKTNGKIFYDGESVVKLTKGGITHDITGTGEGAEEFVAFTNIGEGTAAANFKKAEWVTGTEDVSAPLGFNGKIWEVNADSYPSFISSIYADGATTTTDTSSKD
ncbi:MAG: InlB B-repeat-containing protein [Bacteroides sp.]|nr:InlB B-repeat-containing protein [Bacillota bacterium]MCM1394175.1 InlB B-repeat-containing protein [[Eubacterium] siraeum]MCM1455442.1 InlB B-repeat-containing protein [Bacteroides sp.]